MNRAASRRPGLLKSAMRGLDRTGGLWRDGPAALVARRARPLLRSLPPPALDPRKAITQYAHQVWKTDNGLPQNSIQAILQTRDGYIWLGTERGLVRFDGVQFTVFDKGNTPGHAEQQRAGPLPGPRRQLLGRHVGRAAPFQGRNASPAYTTKEGLSNNRVLAICEDRDGAIWIGTGGGGLEPPEGRQGSPRTRRRTASPTTASGRSRRTASGDLWIGTDGGGLESLSRRAGSRCTRRRTACPPTSCRRSSSTAAATSGSAPTAAGWLRYRDGRFKVYTDEGRPGERLGGVDPGGPRRQSLDRATRAASRG